ncbi:hypothetical protein AB6A40_007084 [Gnathostoma spinigerum]|uniref:Immunoglobulin-binding protein 1 n=1 Tax=Gnathostoma spinigerum TaxID=75299 RepID=A0ABD6EK70_9BILA
MLEMSGDADDDSSVVCTLSKEFALCENLIEELEVGATSTKDLQNKLNDCVARLENLSREIAARGMFSKNESLDELPTSSLQYLLVPSYLAIAIQNIITPPEDRLATLDKAKTYFRDFLERLLSYGIIGFNLPWLQGDGMEQHGESKVVSKLNPSEIRQRKLARFSQQKAMEENLKLLQAQRAAHRDDDSVLRDLLVNRLRLFALKAVNELDAIDEEQPLVEHMMKVRSNEVAAPKKPRVPPSQSSFIIARDAEQKRVFGLGYPGIPTVTVDEWYESMMKDNKYATVKSLLIKFRSSSSDSHNMESNVNEDDSISEADRETMRLRNWDEYKDYHRRGWGNMHNKG